MTALVDTNVVLDVILNRAPFAPDSAGVLAAVELSQCRGLLCATTFTTIHYILRKHLGGDLGLKRISELLTVFEVAAVNRPVVENALVLGFSDFEDAILHESAKSAGADCIVTRNTGDFKKSELLVYSPTQFLAALR